MACISRGRKKELPGLSSELWAPGPGHAGGRVLTPSSETSPWRGEGGWSWTRLTGPDRTGREEAAAIGRGERGGGDTDGKQVGGGWEAGDR